MSLAATQDTSPNLTTAHSSDLKQCADVWFDDGNCVLLAETTVFKVYSGILSKHSEFFGGLFTLPQPEEHSTQLPRYEDCPLIDMQETEERVRYFLKALFDLQFYADVTKIKDVNIIISIVEMSRKYQVDILLRRSCWLLLLSRS